jgi:hypothetical protein
MGVGGDSLNSDFFHGARFTFFQSALDTFLCVSISCSLSSSFLILNCFLTTSFLLSFNNDFFSKLVLLIVALTHHTTPHHTIPPNIVHIPRTHLE